MRAVALLVLMLAAPTLAADPPRRSFYVDMRDGVGIAVDLYLPQVVLTPHIGSATHPARERMARATLEALRRHLAPHACASAA